MNRTPAKWIRSSRWGLYRDTSRGWIAGVCAGIAERVGINPWIVRGAFAAGGLVDRAVPTIVLYIVLAFLLERRGGRLPQDVPAAAGFFADRFQSAPAPFANNGIAAISARFAALDARLNNIEAAVTSDDLSLRRKFRDLGG